MPSGRVLFACQPPPLGPRVRERRQPRTPDASRLNVPGVIGGDGMDILRNLGRIVEAPVKVIDKALVEPLADTAEDAAKGLTGDER